MLESDDCEESSGCIWLMVGGWLGLIAGLAGLRENDGVRQIRSWHETDLKMPDDDRMMTMMPLDSFDCDSNSTECRIESPT